MPSTALLSIGKVAERTGLSVSAIRFYESRGLVAALRTEGGQRQFRRADIRRLSFVMIAQQLGFSIGEIAKQLEQLPADKAPTRKDWSRLGRGFRKDLDARIENLTRLRDTLDGCIGCGCLSLRSCALYNAEDKANQKGVGPRYLLGDRAQLSSEL